MHTISFMWPLGAFIRVQVYSSRVRCLIALYRLKEEQYRTDITAVQVVENSDIDPLVTVDGELLEQPEESPDHDNNLAPTELELLEFVQTDSAESAEIQNDSYVFQANEKPDDNTDPNFDNNHVNVEKPALPPKPDNLAPVRSTSITVNEE